ncbi:MAG: hypothetical protein ABR915_18615 [Thermoguttaceae bacterium]
MADSSQARCRWYRLTPDRLIVGLLALEGFLFLSERFRWFGFTDAVLEHLKGLAKLQRLYLDGTKVTDEGVKKLQEALPNCKIERY